MRAFQKLPVIVLSAIVLFIVTAALAGSKVSIKAAADFGFVYANEHGFAEQQSLLVAAVGPAQVFSFEVASQVGGVILQAVAEPENTSDKVNVSYDHTADDGHRFKVKIGTKTGEIAAPDWEVIPLIKFVNTPHTAAMSLLGKPKTEAERRSSSFFSRTMFIEIHPDFRDTVLGNNFIFTDAMLVDGSPGDIRNVTESFSEPIHGYSDLANFDAAKSSEAASEIEDTLSQGGWNTYIFTDVDVKFVFGIKDKVLQVTGEPYYAFLQVDPEGKTSKLNNELTESFRKNASIEALNPKIYALDRKAFQIAAVLRSFKTGDSEQWTVLVNKVAREVPEPSMETPRAWKP
jgi:hypothetical protein